MEAAMQTRNDQLSSSTPKTLLKLAIVATGSLVLSGCTGFVLLTDENCGTITSESLYPPIIFDIPTSLGPGSESVGGSLKTELTWKVADLPTGHTTDSIVTGALTSTPITGLYSDAIPLNFLVEELSGLNGADPGFSIAAGTRLHFPYDRSSRAVSAGVLRAGDEFTLSHTSIDLSDGPSDFFLASNLTVPAYHPPVTVFASCGSDFAQIINEQYDYLQNLGPGQEDVSGDVERDPDLPLSLENTSSLQFWPGYRNGFIDITRTPGKMIVAANDPNDEGWSPVAVSIAPWFGNAQFEAPDDFEIDVAAVGQPERDWWALSSLAESEIGDLGLSADQPLVFTSSGPDGEFDSDGAELVDGGLVIDINTPLSASEFAQRLSLLTEGSFDANPSELEHLVIYAAFIREIDEDTVELRYSFEHVSPDPSGFGVEKFAAADLYNGVAGTLLGSAQSASNLEINGFTSQDFTALPTTGRDRNFAETLAAFTGAGNLTGLDSGLLMMPGYNARTASLGLTQLQQLQQVGQSFDDDFDIDPFSPMSEFYLGDSYVDNDFSQDEPQVFNFPITFSGNYPNSIVGALAQAIDRDTNIPSDFGPLGELTPLSDDQDRGKPLYDPLTIAFDLTPSAEFLKLEFVLGVTESAFFDEDTGLWEGEALAYPDGVGIFVKSSSQSWLTAVNCAAVPTTSSFVSMANTGIVPPTSLQEPRVVAAENYRALALQTAAADYQFDPNRFVDREISVATGNRIPTPQIAYSTEGADSVIRFVTTTMTCVVDVGDLLVDDDEQVSVGIAAANLFDQVLPPVLFIGASSIRFSDNQVAAEAIVEQEIIAEATGVPLGSNTGSTSSVPTPVAQPAPVAQAGEPRASIRRISETEAKLYLVDVVGAGKIQYILNGRELGWVRAIDATDPKLRVPSSGPMAGRAYFVRTAQLAPGKNVLEVLVDGERVRRVAYTR
jgi:hypothetical protein